MDHLKSVLRAAHCRSTHHFFAVDALDRVQSPAGVSLANMLLRFHDEYLVGAKAPDTTFKDFKNHVLHVQDNHWGGAVRACQKWYEKTLEHLDAGQWKKAAFACGVLSHYLTDPMMPLHTAQSKVESIAHRPMEWSVCKSYHRISARAVALEHPLRPAGFANHAGWLAASVRDRATYANRIYTPLLERYNLEAGCKNPLEGLDEWSLDHLSDIFQLVLDSWAGVLDRLATECHAQIPQFSLGWTSLLATIDVPLAWVVRKISDAGERRAVRKILTEFQETGTVVQNLPKEVKVVQEAAEAELHSKSSPLAESVDPNAQHQHTPSADASSRNAAARSTSPTPATESEPTAITDATPSSASDRQGVHLDSNLVHAPSIGPKTARRFQRIFVTTIRQFLESNPQDLAVRLDTRWITADLLCDWQDQARLVCEVGELCGYKSQLLVAVGCRNASQLARARSQELHRKISELCEQSAGQRILRSSRLPTVEDIEAWILDAQNSLGTSQTHASDQAA